MSDAVKPRCVSGLQAAQLQMRTAAGGVSGDTEVALESTIIPGASPAVHVADPLLPLPCGLSLASPPHSVLSE